MEQLSVGVIFGFLFFKVQSRLFEIYNRLCSLLGVWICDLVCIAVNNLNSVLPIFFYFKLY